MNNYSFCFKLVIIILFYSCSSNNLERSKKEELFIYEVYNTLTRVELNSGRYILSGKDYYKQVGGEFVNNLIYAMEENEEIFKSIDAEFKYFEQYDDLKPQNYELYDLVFSYKEKAKGLIKKVYTLNNTINLYLGNYKSSSLDSLWSNIDIDNEHLNDVSIYRLHINLLILYATTNNLFLDSFSDNLYDLPSTKCELYIKENNECHFYIGKNLIDFYKIVEIKVDTMYPSIYDVNDIQFEKTAENHVFTSNKNLNNINHISGSIILLNEQLNKQIIFRFTKMNF